MGRKLFSLDTSSVRSQISHNSILITPKIDGIRIMDLYIFDQFGQRIDVIDVPIAITKSTVFNYDIVSSSDIWIDIDHPSIQFLDPDELISVSIAVTNFLEYAKIEFDETTMSFHKNLVCGYSIENAGDSFINMNLGIRVYDRYNNLMSTDSVDIGLNDDNFVLKKQIGGTKVDLQTEPEETSIRVLISGEYTDEFTVSGKTINIDIPDGVPCYVLYQPKYIQEGSFTKVSETMSINSNNEIRLDINNGSIIKYRATVEIVNTNISNTNSTPVIKNIAIIASSR